MRAGLLGETHDLRVRMSSAVAAAVTTQPALARRRAPALRLSHLQPGRTRATTLRPDRAGLLDSLAEDIAVVSVDFMQYAESSYDGDDRTSLASQVDSALTLAELAAASDDRAVRQSGEVLEAPSKAG